MCREEHRLGAEGNPTRLGLTSWISVDILNPVKIVRIRRVGNSNVVSIPKELEAAGYTPGANVLLEQLPDGALRLIRTDDVSALIRRVGREVVAEDRDALKILAAHDRSNAPTAAD